MTPCLQELTNLGVSIWLDDLSRERLVTGNLAHLVDSSCVRGVTTNPAIFQKAISEKADAYSADLSRLEVFRLRNAVREHENAHLIEGFITVAYCQNQVVSFVRSIDLCTKFTGHSVL